MTCKLQQNFDNVQQQNNSNLKYLSKAFTFETTIELWRTRKKFIPTNYNRFVMSCNKVQLDELMKHNKISMNNNKVKLWWMTIDLQCNKTCFNLQQNNHKHSTNQCSNA
jgi:hypothetical protein